MKIWAAIVSLALLVCLSWPVNPVKADGPTPTPTPTEQMYSRSSLLSGLHVKDYQIIQVPTPIDTGQIINTVVDEGGSYYLTFDDIFRRTGAMPLLIGGIVLLFIVFVIMSFIIKRTGNARTAIKNNVVYQRVNMTRREFRHFRRRH
jgi:hypothetical protein